MRISQSCIAGLTHLAAHRDALRYARGSGQTPIMLDALLWTASSLSVEDVGAACEVARSVLGHPATHEALREDAGQLLDQRVRDRDVDIGDAGAQGRSVAEAMEMTLARLIPAGAGAPDAGVQPEGR